MQLQPFVGFFFATKSRISINKSYFCTVQLADAVKRGACSLGSGQPDSQVMVINAVKDVAAALGELINATKLASGKPINDPAMQDLKETARVS